MRKLLSIAFVTALVVAGLTAVPQEVSATIHMFQLADHPNGSQDPGHPPGDNWFYYRSPEGLRPSIRIVSFREGLIDYALLKALGARCWRGKGIDREDRALDHRV